jgi:alkanesulfonate monooxygenase SsuD/methylene tetrahydromethanopterin reductase-like flavin-dependent oxidoreductase (luciferase family)
MPPTEGPATPTFWVSLRPAKSSPGVESAHNAIKGLVMIHARFSGYEGKDVMAGVDSIRNTAAALDDMLIEGHRGIASRAGVKPNEVDFYPDAVDDSFVDRFAIVGNPDFCAERLKEIAELGISRIYIGTRAVGADPEEHNTHLIGTQVLPLVRGTLG